MKLIVQKYGGTSVGDTIKMQNVANRIISKKEQGYDVVVVVSAMGKTTDRLVELAKSISKNPHKRDLDMLMSTGEQISISLLSMLLKDKGYDCVCLTGFQAGIKTEGQHTKSKISDIEIENIKNYLYIGQIVIVAGFQGVNESGDITTLGRGGSDTTAVALSAKLDCGCEIYTDVDGIYSVDPRLYSGAKKLDYISYEDMIEMASLGAGVMETRAVEIGCKYNVEIYVASSINNSKGTYIGVFDREMEKKIVTGLSIADNRVLVRLDNILMYSKFVGEVFDKISKEYINIDTITQTMPIDNRVSISFTASSEDEYMLRKVINDVKKKYSEIEVFVEYNIVKVSIVGVGLMNQSGLIGRLFILLSENDIRFKQITTSEKSISYTIDSKDRDRLVEVLAHALDL